jgi:hypothetical protein
MNVNCKLFTVLLLAANVAHAQPKLGVVSDIVHDFGRVFQGKDVSYVVVVKNEGTADLNIIQVNTGCNCTEATLSKPLLHPSDTAMIHILFHTARFNGPFQKAFDIRSNDPTAEHKYLRYKVNVISVLQANPLYFYLGDIIMHEENHSSIYLRNITDKQVTITSVHASLDSIHMTVASPVVAPGDSTLLTASFVPTRNIYYKGEVIIETDSEIQPKFKVYYGFVKNPRR